MSIQTIKKKIEFTLKKSISISSILIDKKVNLFLLILFTLDNKFFIVLNFYDFHILVN